MVTGFGIVFYEILDIDLSSIHVTVQLKNGLESDNDIMNIQKVLDKRRRSKV